jgi:hypothetical protein
MALDRCQKRVKQDGDKVAVRASTGWAPDGYVTPTKQTNRKEMKMALKEYKPGTAFSGVIGRTFDVSQPAWPELARYGALRR